MGVYVGFVTCWFIYVCGLFNMSFLYCVDFVICVCVCGFCNVWVCVCVDYVICGFVTCGCVYVWIM